MEKNKQAKSARHQTMFHGDPVIWIVFFILCAISIVEVYSATSSLTYKDGRYWSPIVQHSIYLGIGFLLVFLVHNIKCKWFKLYPLFVLPISYLLLFLVLVMGVSTNGASRYIDFFGIHFQPSELAKGAVAVGVALILSVMQTSKGADKHAIKYILIVTGIAAALILPENFSTAALLCLVVLFMMFLGRVPYLQISKLLGVLAIAGILFVAVLLAIPKGATNKGMLHRFSTWSARIQDFGNHKEETSDPKTYNYANNAQVANANIAIATCNYVGRMPGNSVQRDFLSQAYSDFIFAIIIEEMGLAGGVGVLFLYLVLLFRAKRIANKCAKSFPAFLVMGLALLLVVQAMINMCVAVGLIPVTGQPLPLISRGGTSTLINCVYIGMILSVSWTAKKREEYQTVSENHRQTVAAPSQQAGNGEKEEISLPNTVTLA